MSDFFHAATNPGDLYGINILRFVTMLQYTVEHTPSKPLAIIYSKEQHQRKRSQNTYIPARYAEHMKHFLWRYYLLSALYQTFGSGPNKIILPDGTTFLAKMVIMMDTLAEQLLSECREFGKNVPHNLRSTLFNVYLTTEFVVGRHDSHSVEKWRREPRNIHLELEQIDPFRLDWELYETRLGDLLGGRKFGWNVDNVGKEDLLDLLDAVGQWFNIQLRPLGQVRNRKLVNGSAGMGYVLVGGVDVSSNAGVEGRIKSEADEAR